MPETDLIAVLHLAEQLGRDAGKLALAGRRNFVTERKADDSEVTSIDRAIQEHILQGIAQRFPDHAVVAEERSSALARFPNWRDARHCWVIDPLDGTRNFVRGFPCHGTSIAVLEAGLPVVGMVYDHHTDLLFSVIAGQKPTCNGDLIAASTRPYDRQILVAVPSGRNISTGPVIRAWMDDLILRNTGSTALHLALVASGALDAAYCRECRVWDVAAGWLLVTSSGGLCTDLEGKPLFPIDLDRGAVEETPFLAGSPQAHAGLMRSLKAGVPPAFPSLLQ